MTIPEASIGEITDAIIDYRGKTPRKSASGMPLLTAKVIKDGTIDKSRLEYISEETYASWMRRGYPRQWDVLITTEAPLGETALLRTHERIALAQRVILLRGNPALVDQRYLFAALRSPLVQDRLRQRASGTTVLGIKQKELRQVQIPLPPLLTQRRVAAILSAYDDLIENNLRRIRILHEIGQRFYREWFVEFRYPGHEDVPRVDSELGPIPEGWDIAPMSRVADVVDCLHSKKPALDPGGKGVLLQLFNIGDAGILDLTQKYTVSDRDYSQWTSRIEVRAGDCVVTNVGRVGAVAQIPSGVVAALGRNMTAIRARDPLLTPTFLLEYLLSPHMSREVQLKKDSGSIMDSLNVKGIIRLSVPVPGHDLMVRFERLARTLRREIEVLNLVLGMLRAARDLLLARLISGEIDVDNMDIALQGPVA
jgi:type I restriction enzyme S subunit